MRSKSKLHRETKQKSKRKSEESQLPLKSKGCNEIQGFRGNCDSKASWGCAPALPNQFRVVFLGAIQSVSHETLHQNRMTASNEPQANKKFFGAAVFQKCCRGVGEQPTFAKQIQFCSLFFLLQLHFLKLANSQFDCLCETSCKFGQGNGAIAARWQAKAGVEPPFAGCGRPFSLEAIFRTFHMKHCIKIA